MTQQVGISPSRRDGITINSIVAPTVENGGLFSMDPSGILRGAKPNFKSVMSRRPRKSVKNLFYLDVSSRRSTGMASHHFRRSVAQTGKWSDGYAPSKASRAMSASITSKASSGMKT